MGKTGRQELGEPGFHGDAERLPILGDYCLSGKLIISIYGPASIKFATHVERCKQCEVALELERPHSPN